MEIYCTSGSTYNKNSHSLRRQLGGSSVKSNFLHRMKNRLYTYLLLAILMIPSHMRAQTGPEERIRIRIPSSIAMQDKAGAKTSDSSRPDSTEIEIYADELAALKKQFGELKILESSPLLDASDMASNLAEAMSFTKYPTYPQYDSMMHYFAETYPEICRIDTIGYSIQGRLILALKISDNVATDEDEPAVFFTGTIHGDELAGYVLSLRLIDFILKNYGSNIEIDRIVDDLQLWINPLSNPDGTFYPDNDNSVAGSRRGNVRGLDLNRNYPDPGYGEADDTSGIEPENQYMMLFMHERKFDISANFHGGAEVVNYPWDHKYIRHPDTDWFVLISQEYADEARAVSSSYMDAFVDDSTGITGITNGADWYVIHGGRQDYVTYFLRGRELTIEMSNTKQVPSEQLETFWTYNQWSLINLISQARYGIHGRVRSANSGAALKAKIWVQSHDNDSSWIESDKQSGNFYRYLKEGTYSLIIAAEGYVSDTLRNVYVADYQRSTVDVLLDSAYLGVGSGMESEIRLYPNPASEYLVLKIPPQHETRKIRVINLMGITVYEDLLSSYSDYHRIDARSFGKGYFMLMISDSQKNTLLPFIIR